MTQNGLPIARPTPNTSQLSCESSCRWTVSDTVLGWGSRPLVFFARYLAGRLERPAVLPCVAQTGVVSPVGGDQAPGITRGVSFRVRGQSSPHRATQRLSAGRARDHPVMEIVPNKALSLSLSLSPVFFGEMLDHLDKRFYGRRIYSQPVYWETATIRSFRG